MHWLYLKINVIVEILTTASNLIDITAHIILKNAFELINNHVNDSKRLRKYSGILDIVSKF